MGATGFVNRRLRFVCGSTHLPGIKHCGWDYKSRPALVQITQDDPSLEENRKPATTSTTGSHILLEGLTPAQTYWFRVRAMGSGGPGLWADPVSLIVV